MAENNRESSMEEILSSIKRIIAEDKAIDEDRPAARRKSISRPTLQAVPDVVDTVEEPEILELTNKVNADPAPAERLIDDQKLIAMRQSLSALVNLDNRSEAPVVKASSSPSIEDLTREMMRPMLKKWLDENLPQLVEKMVAREIERITGK